MVRGLGELAIVNPPAPVLVLRDGDQDDRAAWARSTAIRAGLAVRARIILLTADKGRVTHWASRLIAGHWRIGNATGAGVAQVRGPALTWQDIQVLRRPGALGKVTDMVDLYLVGAT